MAVIYAPTAIDLSRLSPPTAIESLDFETLYSGFKERFLAAWDDLRAVDSTLPEFDVLTLEVSPAAIVGQAWSYLRLLDRQRVNDAFKALLAPLATGSDLDALVAGRNIQRLTVVPAIDAAPAIMEGDASLLRRYLESFDAPSAGSEGRYLHDARSAWPQSQDKTLGLWDARVNGYATHGRRGDVDLVIAGPYGRAPTTAELLTIKAAVSGVNRAPEGVSIVVMAAVRTEYQVSLVVEVPGNGPAPETIRAEAEARVRAAAQGRLLIGGEVPAGFLAGAAYGPNVIKVRDLAPVAIPPDPYRIPVITAISVAVEVRT